MVLPNGAGGFKAKGAMIASVPKFHGNHGENAYAFLSDYLSTCSALKEDGQEIETVYMGMFTFA